jgi:hypothetical protein
MTNQTAVPCNAAQLHRFGDLSSEHGPHEWIVQPGMPAVRCPGTAAAPAGQAPAAVDEISEQVLHGLDFNYVASLGYGTPEELLAAYDASRTPAPAPAPAGQAEAVLRVVETALGDTLVASARDEALAGIAAVLHAAPVDQAAEVERLRLQNERMRHELEVMYGGAFDSPDRSRPADRAAVLRDAAERIDATFTGPGIDRYTRYGADLLRRVADETQPAETSFVPPTYYRRDDDVDCCVHAVPVGPDSCPACRELANDDRPASGPTVLDEVVAALQAKAQSLSMEAEEEMRRDLEDQAQVWHEAAELARRAGRKAARREQPAVGARQDGDAS